MLVSRFHLSLQRTRQTWISPNLAATLLAPVGSADVFHEYLSVLDSSFDGCEMNADFLSDLLSRRSFSHPAENVLAFLWRDLGTPRRLLDTAEHRAVFSVFLYFDGWHATS